MMAKTVTVLPGAMDELKLRGWLADYITDSIDGKTGTVVNDHRDVVGCPHWGVELGFEFPVGIPEHFLKET